MDVLLRGGRVVDPGSGADAASDVLVTGGTVAAVAPDLAVPVGADVVDVRGMVVGPGFVDLHSHVHTVLGQRLQALDGVTTCLDPDPYAWPPPAGAATHPRTSGTFAKALRLMVRETGTWSWLEAFRRCSYLPTRVLAEVAPAMLAKGYLAPGADADLVVLNPERASDSATFLDSTRPSVGVRQLLVGGDFVGRDGDLQLDALAGTAVRGRPR